MPHARYARGIHDNVRAADNARDIAPGWADIRGPAKETAATYRPVNCRAESSMRDEAARGREQRIRNLPPCNQTLDVPATAARPRVTFSTPFFACPLFASFFERQLRDFVTYRALSLTKLREKERER